MVSCGPTYEKTDLVQMYDMGDMRGPLPLKIDDPESISGIISFNPQFSKFRYILRLSGLDDQFNLKNGINNKGYTIFIPDDLSLSEIPEDVFINMDKLTARQIVEYSTLPYRITGDILQDSSSNYIYTNNQKHRLLITNPNPFQIFVNNNILVKETDIQCNNGIIHVVDKLLWPYTEF